MGKTIQVATIQLAVSEDKNTNLKQAYALIEKAKVQGAQLVVLPELFYLPYFPKVKDPKYFEYAQSIEDCDVIKYMRDVAKKLNIMLVVSFFERADKEYFNSLVLINNDGEILKDKQGRDRYRKSHIPDGPGYNEKYYFSKGNTGFVVWETPIGNIGCGICWDQWYPESARIMTLLGADIICYPSAIGSEPESKDLDTSKQWHRVMKGEAVANRVPIIAANRIGTEKDQSISLTFYGSSFITDETGKIIQKAPYYKAGQDTQEGTGIIMAKFDIDVLKKEQGLWGIFDRRPDCYEEICRTEQKPLIFSHKS